MMKKIADQVRSIINLLALGRFQEIDSLTNGIRLPANQMAEAIAVYGRVLIEPPEEGYELMDVVEVTDVNPRRWSVTMPLWTREEGRSDLTLELTFIEDGDQLHVELDDIHVL